VFSEAKSKNSDQRRGYRIWANAHPATLEVGRKKRAAAPSLGLNIGAGFRSLGIISLTSMSKTKSIQESFDESLIAP
jgi:hypothetical protein